MTLTSPTLTSLMNETTKTHNKHSKIAAVDLCAVEHQREELLESSMWSTRRVRVVYNRQLSDLRDEFFAQFPLRQTSKRHKVAIARVELLHDLYRSLRGRNC